MILWELSVNLSDNWLNSWLTLIVVFTLLYECECACGSELYMCLWMMNWRSYWRRLMVFDTHLLKERKCEWCTRVFMFVSIRRRKESASGILCCMCCIHSSKEEECKWDKCVSFWYSFVEGRGVQMVYICDIYVPYSCFEYVACARCCGHRKLWLLCDKYIEKIYIMTVMIFEYWFTRFIKKILILIYKHTPTTLNNGLK